MVCVRKGNLTELIFGIIYIEMVPVEQDASSICISLKSDQSYSGSGGSSFKQILPIRQLVQSYKYEFTDSLLHV